MTSHELAQKLHKQGMETIKEWGGERIEKISYC